jgi:hypothetical protein
MEYSIQRGKGSFLVNARSGHELLAVRRPCWDHNAVDSKVIVVEQNSVPENDVRLVHRPPPLQPAFHSMHMRDASMEPLPAQVAAHDELLQKIKATSEHEHKQNVKQEQRELKKAISASKLQVERLEQEREEQLAVILKQSQDEQLLAQEQEEREMADALQRSLEEQEIRRRMEEQWRREEEERLAVVLAASQQQQQEEEVSVRKREAMLLERAISISQLQVSQHDKVLEEVLAQSVHDMRAVDCELEEVLKVSMKETTLNTDDLIQQALLLNMNETQDESVANVRLDES